MFLIFMMVISGADNRNPENLSHYEIFNDFLNSWESPHFKTRDGKDLAFF